jgi:hypothetical protein
MSDLDRDSKTVSLSRSPHFRVNTRYEEEDEYLGTEKKRATIRIKANNTDRFSLLIFLLFYTIHNDRLNKRVENPSSLAPTGL